MRVTAMVEPDRKPAHPAVITGHYLSVGVLHVRQTLVRVTNHGARAEEGRTRLMFQEPKTPQSCRTVPIPEECWQL